MQISVNRWGTAGLKEQLASIDRKDGRERGQRGILQSPEAECYCSGGHTSRAAFQEAAAAATVSWNRKLAGLSKGSNHPCKLHEQVPEVRGQETTGIVQRPNSKRDPETQNEP